MILSCPSCTKRFLLDAALLGSGRRVKCGRCGHVWFQTPVAPKAAAAATQKRAAAQKQPRSAPEPAARTAPRPAPPPPPPPPPPTFAGSFLDELDAVGQMDGLDGMDGDGRGGDGPSLTPPPPSEFERPRPIPRGSNLPVPVEPDRHRRNAWLRWGGLAAGIAALLAGLYFGRPAILEAWPAANQLYSLVGLGEAPVGAGLALPLDKVKAEFREVEGLPFLFVSGEVVNTSDKARPVPDVLAKAMDKDKRVIHTWRIVPSARRLFPGQSATFDSRVPEKGGEAHDIGFDFIAPEKPAK